MAEEEPLAELILELLRRRRRLTLSELMRELFAEPRIPRVREQVLRILRRLEVAGAVLIAREYIRGPIYRLVVYYARPVRELVARMPGRRITERELSQRLGIPLAEVPRIVQLAIERGWLRTTPEAGVYEVPPRLYRVQKWRVYRTMMEKKKQFYQVRFAQPERLPTQLVLEGLAPAEETPELAESTFGAVRVVVYTAAPERWPEERLERIMRGLFAQERISFEIAARRPYVDVHQAYEARPIDPDELPSPELIDRPLLWLWANKQDVTYVYEYYRGPLGWEYRRYRVT